MEKILRWYSVTTAIDEETGEILTKDRLKRKEYILTKTEKKTRINGNIGEITTVRFYRQHQISIFV